MNNERTVILENVGGCPLGLKDTQARTYRLAVDAKVRISEVSLQDILDYPATKVFFDEGKVKIRNIEGDKLFDMGLTETEIKKYLIEEPKKVVTAGLLQLEEIVEKVEEKEMVVMTEDAPVEEKQEVIVVKKSTNKTGKKNSGKKSGNLHTK